MSAPVNPLDKFSTYSYHFLLFAANNTEVVRTLSDTSANGGFDTFYNRASGSLVRTGPRPTDVVTVVLNTMIDSTYTVDSLNYTTTYGGNPTDGSLIIATPIKMTIREPGGVNFMNDLQKIFNETLKSSSNGVIFGLKIFFVGHLPDGSIDQSVRVRDIYMQMIDLTASFDEGGGVYSIQFVCVGGGAVNDTYETRYVKRNRALAINGNKLIDMIKAFEKKLNDELEEEYTKVKDLGGRKVKYHFTTPTVWDNFVIDSATNDNYEEKTHPKGKTTVTETGGGAAIVGRNRSTDKQTDQQIEMLNTQKTNYQTQIQKNQEKIILLDETDRLKNTKASDSQIRDLQKNNEAMQKNIANINAQLEQLNKKKEQQAQQNQQNSTKPANDNNQDAKASSHSNDPVPTKNGKTYFNTSVQMTIYQTIKEMLKRCPNIHKRVADKAKATGSKVTFESMEFFRIVSNITSDGEGITYHVDIHDLFMPATGTDGALKIGSKEIPKEKYNDIGYVFDYIFSGKNTDILNFDMKLINGALMLNRNINRTTGDNQKIASATDPVNGKTPADSSQKNPVVDDQKTYSPVYTSAMSVDNQKGNTAIQSDSKMSDLQMFMTALSQFAALSSLDTSVTIRGNPDLLDSIIPTLYPHEKGAYEAQVKKINDEARKIFDGSSAGTIKDYKLNFPLLVKINIFSKSENWTPENPTYHQPFWYTGWYMGTRIDNKFSAGSFIQQLYLTAIDANPGAKVAVNGGK